MTTYADARVRAAPFVESLWALRDEDRDVRKRIAAKLRAIANDIIDLDHERAMGLLDAADILERDW